MSAFSGSLLLKHWFPPPVIILNSRGIFCLLMFLDLLIAYVLTLLFPEIWTLNHHFPSLSSRHFNKFSKWSRRFGYTLLSIIISSYILSVCLPSEQKSLYGTIATRGMFAVFSSCIYLMHKCEFALGRSLSFRMTRVLWAGTVTSTVLKSIAWAVLRVAASSVHAVKKLCGLFDRKSTFPKKDLEKRKNGLVLFSHEET